MWEEEATGHLSPATKVPAGFLEVTGPHFFHLCTGVRVAGQINLIGPSPVGLSNWTRWNPNGVQSRVVGFWGCQGLMRIYEAVPCPETSRRSPCRQPAPRRRRAGVLLPDSGQHRQAPVSAASRYTCGPFYRRENEGSNSPEVLKSSCLSHSLF